MLLALLVYLLCGSLCSSASIGYFIHDIIAHIETSSMSGMFRRSWVSLV